jgi:hypothetical protein
MIKVHITSNRIALQKKQTYQQSVEIQKVRVRRHNASAIEIIEREKLVVRVCEIKTTIQKTK